MYFYDPTYFLVLIGFLLASFASTGVQRAFNKYSKVKSMRHYTGKDAARKILDDICNRNNLDYRVENF